MFREVSNAQAQAFYDRFHKMIDVLCKKEGINGAVYVSLEELRRLTDGNTTTPYKIKHVVAPTVSNNVIALKAGNDKKA